MIAQVGLLLCERDLEGEERSADVVELEEELAEFDSILMAAEDGEVLLLLLELFGI